MKTPRFYHWVQNALCIVFAISILCSGCVHAPRTVTVPVQSDRTITDASQSDTGVFWRDLRFEYYRTGKMIFMEWGKVFTVDPHSGRILVYSPEGESIEHRAFIFSEAELVADDLDAMSALLQPALLAGWTLGDVFDMDRKTIVAQCYPTSSDAGELDQDDISDEQRWFMFQMFLMFLDLIVQITLN